MTRHAAALRLVALVVAVAPAVASAQEFTFLPPGDLIPGSGEGRADDTVYVPGMRFPIESAPAYPNSQVYMNGGYLGPGGGQCDAVNFSYPWRDNYCETRQWDMPLCPSGNGHQGQDIRGATCEKSVHTIVSSVDGEVTSIGTYSLYITAADGTRHDFLHSDNITVSVGDTVTRGQPISRVSNEFGGTPTSVHLHFNLRQNVSGVGNVYVPPYTSLIESYYELVGPPVPPVSGSLDQVDCAGISGWVAATEALEETAEARLYFDGGPGENQAVGHPVLAGDARDDLCEAIGSCDHGFSSGLPLSLLDSADHAVRAFGTRGPVSEQAELENSPKTFNCPLELPEGVRRAVRDAAAESAWHFSSFWDVATVSAGVIDGFPAGDDLPDAPRVVIDEAGALWVVDGSLRRAVADAVVAAAWELDPLFAEPIPAADLEALAEGPALRARPFVLRGPDGVAYLIDDAPGTGSGSGPSGAGGNGAGGSGPAVGAGLVGGVGPGGGTAPGDEAEDGGSEGCGCEVPRSSGTPSAAFVALGVGLLGLVRRRRRS